MEKVLTDHIRRHKDIAVFEVEIVGRRGSQVSMITSGPSKDLDL